MGPNDDNESVLYEVNLEAEADIAGPFDTWLRDHIADMLQLGGFLSAEILEDAEAPAGKIHRTVQYRLSNQAALDHYLVVEAPRMRADGGANFGEKFSAQRRVLAHREEYIRGAVSTENCLNCGEVLTGQHCSHCGQRAKVRVLSFTSLMRDFLGDVTDFDARIWRTIRPLAFKPGALTVEFLRGRRTHYSPPFRMYLILSVAFFLVASLGESDINFQFDNDGKGNASFDVVDDAGKPVHEDANRTPASNASKPTAGKSPEPSAQQRGVATPAGQDAAAATEQEKQRQRLIDAIVKRLPENERAQARLDLAKELRAMTPQQSAQVSRLMDDPCSKDNFKLQAGPLLRKYEPRLREACHKMVADSKSFGHAVFQNIPKMMFLFLPLIAGLMFVLYIGSGRYYIEHLLFFVHYHAFFFLSGFVLVALSKLADLFVDTTAARWLHGAADIFTAVLIFYIPYYLYRAMRRVYAQGRAITLLKFVMLVLGYLVFMTLTAVGLLFYTALTL